MSRAKQKESPTKVLREPLRLKKERSRLVWLVLHAPIGNLN